MKILSLIYFVVCHVGPAEHFATISKELEKEGHEVEFYASAPALKRLEKLNISKVTAFDTEALSEDEVEYFVEGISGSEIIITDMGHPFNEVLLKTLSEKGLKPIGYYDNGESYVPGGYSETSAKAMRYASKVLFANANLANAPIYEIPGTEIDYPLINRIGLGYFPLEQVQKIADLRSCQHKQERTQFFLDNNLLDIGQKVFVYFGGNNTEYFEKAFPSFLEILSKSVEKEDLSNVVIVFQQHPGAKIKNLDGRLLKDWIDTSISIKAPRIIFSSMTSDQMLLIAEGALYYQTSMGPTFAWAGIPIIQVGHEINNDVLVRGGLCTTATNAKDFTLAILNIKEDPLTLDRKKVIFSSLGIKEDWYQIFKSSILAP